MQARDITAKNVKSLCQGTGIELSDDLTSFELDGQSHKLSFPVHARSALARILIEKKKLVPAKTADGGSRRKRRGITLSSLECAEFWASQDPEVISKAQEAIAASEQLRVNARRTELAEELAALRAQTEKTQKEFDELGTK
jgi:hypothetical protein